MSASKPSHSCEKSDYIAFFRKQDPFSNFYPSPFKLEGFNFRDVEMYFHFKKAQFFGDYINMERILKSDTPYQSKQFGRRVVGFDVKAWEEVRKEIMKDGCRAKFDQNPKLAALLIESEGKKLIEASPFDGFWGVKKDKHDPDINNEKSWPSDSNNLGKILMEIRSEVKNDLL